MSAYHIKQKVSCMRFAVRQLYAKTGRQVENHRLSLATLYGGAKSSGLEVRCFSLHALMSISPVWPDLERLQPKVLRSPFCIVTVPVFGWTYVFGVQYYDSTCVKCLICTKVISYFSFLFSLTYRKDIYTKNCVEIWYSV